MLVIFAFTVGVVTVARSIVAVVLGLSVFLGLGKFERREVEERCCKASCLRCCKVEPGRDLRLCVGRCDGHGYGCRWSGNGVHLDACEKNLGYALRCPFHGRGRI